jgi:hypothetical protein
MSVINLIFFGESESIYVTLPFRDKRMFIQFQSAASHLYDFVSLSVRVLNYTGTSVIRTDSEYGGGADR